MQLFPSLCTMRGPGVLHTGVFRFKLTLKAKVYACLIKPFCKGLVSIQIFKMGLQ